MGRRKKHTGSGRPGGRRRAQPPQSPPQDPAPAGPAGGRLAFIGASPWFAPVLTGGYALLLVFTVFHHEMWRDEIQAWLIARESTGIFDLFRNMRYEGHPVLWNLLLMPITRLSANPFGMQVLHALTAAATVFLVARYAPFNPLQKILFALGYFPLYEWGVISRNYALGLLLVVVLCVLLPQRRQKPLRVALVLFLLSWTSIYGCIIAIGVTLGLALDYFLHRHSADVRKLSAALLVVIAGVVTSALQMKPPPDGSSQGWYTGFHAGHFENLLAAFAKAFFPVPNGGPHFWGSSILPPDYGALIACVLLAAIIILYRHRPAAVAMYLLCTLGLLAFIYMRHFGVLRHHGFLFAAFLLLAWGAHYLVARNGGNRLAPAAGYLLTALLLVQAIGGLRAVANEVEYPFSMAKRTAEYIKAENLHRLPMIGVKDFAASTVIGYLQAGKVDYVRQNRGKSFVVWDNTWRRGDVPDAAIIARARQIAGQTGGRVLLIMNRQLAPDAARAVQLIATFTGSVIRDEDFILYIYNPPNR